MLSHYGHRTQLLKLNIKIRPNCTIAVFVLESFMGGFQPKRITRCHLNHVAGSRVLLERGLKTNDITTRQIVPVRVLSRSVLKIKPDQVCILHLFLSQKYSYA